MLDDLYHSNIIFTQIQQNAYKIYMVRLRCFVFSCGCDPMGFFDKLYKASDATIIVTLYAYYKNECKKDLLT